MKCPYCAQEIKNEAIVCHHCGRDLSDLKPTLHRISALEDRLSEVNALLNSLQTTAVFLPTPRERLPFRRYALAVGLSVLLWSLGALPFFLISNLIERVFNFVPELFSISPILFGFWIGVTIEGRPWVIYALNGVAVGLLMLPMVGIFISLEAIFLDLSDLFGLFQLTSFILGPGLLFVSGELLGDVVKGWADKLRLLASARYQEAAEARGTQGGAGLAAIITGIAGSAITGAATITAQLLGNT